MKPEILALCRYASERDGQLSIIDTFDSIVVTKLPWRDYFYIVAKINIIDCDVDYETFVLSIHCKDESEKQIFKAASRFIPPKDLGKLNIVAGLKGLIFEAAGNYCFRICMDETVIAEYPFKVILKDNDGSASV